MIEKYRKKPVVIEAIELSEDWVMKCHDFVNNGKVGGFPELGNGIDPADGKFKITTLEGVMIVNIGDYIIKGINGEFYPCKPDIFNLTYEIVND